MLTNLLSRLLVSRSACYRRACALVFALVFASGPTGRAAQTYVQDLANTDGVVVTSTAVSSDDGSVYVLGHFLGPKLVIGTTELAGMVASGATYVAAGPTHKTGFLAKLGHDGGWRWALVVRDWPLSGNLSLAKVVATSRGVYIAGHAPKGVWVGTPSGGFGGGERDEASLSLVPWVVRVRPDGQFVWARAASNRESLPNVEPAYTADAWVYGLAVDSAGSAYVCGSFRSASLDDAAAGRGLNFGNQHAFRARDTSGTPSSGSDWTGVTRDGFVAKLDVDGNWRWVATGGTRLEGALDGFFGVAVDDAKQVYVVGNVNMTHDPYVAGGLLNGGLVRADWDADQLNSKARGLSGPTSASTTASLTSAFLGKLAGEATQTVREGAWIASSTLEPGEAYGRDVAWVRGSVYAIAYRQASTDLFLARVTANFSAIEKTATIVGTGVNDVSLGNALAYDNVGNIYVNGVFGSPQANFNGPGNVVQFVPKTSRGQSLFAGKLDADMNWKWVQQANGVTPTFGAISGAVDPATGRFYFAGSYKSDLLSLGAETNPTVLPPGAVASSVNRSFLSAIESNGSFLEQVNFTLLTEFGAAVSDPPSGSLTVFRGSTVQSSVPPILYEDAAGASIPANRQDLINQNAVVRRTCIGYEGVDNAVAGDTPSYSFTIDADTRIRYKWKTEYALEIRNNRDNVQGGLDSPAAGNPDPVVLKHWVEKDSLETAFIDGEVASAAEFGVRYRSTGFQASGGLIQVLSRAPTFGGSGQYVDVGTVNAPDFNAGLTLEAWVNFDRLVDWGGIVEFALPDRSSAIMLANVGTSRDLQFRGYQGTSWTTEVTAPNVVTPGQWQHVAVSVEPTAGVATLFVNGLAVATRTNGVGKLPAVVSRSKCYIGYGPASTLAPFAGRIGEVRFWNRARTGEEIRSTMLVPVSGSTTNLVGYWPLAAVSGTQTPNLAAGASGNPGTLVGADASIFRPGNLTSFFVPWGGVQARQQVPQFIMSGPIGIEYRWVRENRVQVSSAPFAASGALQTVVGGVTNLGAGEFWFPQGSRVRISAAETFSNGAESYSVKGFINGLGNVREVNGAGTAGGGRRTYEIASLSAGSAITWDYSDKIYRGRVVIGEAINFGAGGTFAADPIRVEEAVDTTKAPVATTLVSGNPPGSTVEDVRIWDTVAKRLYPLRPGKVLLEWVRASTAGSSRNILTEIEAVYPSAASYAHVANTPPVPLDADKTNAVAFAGIRYAENAKAIVSDGGEFSFDDDKLQADAWTVLLFTEVPAGQVPAGDPAREQLRVRTVLTRRWDRALQTADAVIGSAITSPLHGAAVPHNGYVYWPKARYNPDIYDRTTRLGPIIPVNQWPGAKPDENIVVVWYQTVEGIHWPGQAVQYNPVWPVNTPNRIVIASRLGSEGLDLGSTPQRSFGVDRYSDVKIYNQPDRGRPGYNPNEEHALIAPSALRSSDPNPPPTAFALRNNLNLTGTGTNYTSDPYVLVQFYDRQATNYGMAAYKVQVDDLNWPARRLVFAVGEPSALTLTLGADGRVEFNFPSPISQTGMRVDEIVEFEPNDNLVGTGPGRYRITPIVDGSPSKFVLTPVTGGAPVTASAIVRNPANNKVMLFRSFPYTFDYLMHAGEPVVAPYPLQTVIGATPCAATVGENIDPARLVYWEDHKKQPWAVSGSADPAAGGMRVQFHYPLLPAFWMAGTVPGECVAYVSNSLPIWVTNRVLWPATVPALKAGETLTFAGGEANRDDANQRGLPGVLGWAAGRVVFDDANPAMDPYRTPSNYLARLAAPLLPVEVALPLAKIPAELLPAAKEVTVNGAVWSFNKLDASLGTRVYYDQLAQKLGVRGYLDGKTLGDPSLTAAPGSLYVLQPNILTADDYRALTRLTTSGSPDWLNAVSNLYALSRDPGRVATNFTGSNAIQVAAYGVGLEAARATNGAALPGQARPATLLGPGLALLPNAALLDSAAAPALPEGYVTLAENDDDRLGDAPVVLHILRVQRQPMYRGAIKTLVPTNPFDERVTLRHSGDFGANAGSLVFEWYYRPDDGRSVGLPDAAPDKWSVFPDPNGAGGRGLQEIQLAGASSVLLSDNRFFVRWRHANNPTGWSQWAGAANSRPPGPGEQAAQTYVPQLAEGWVKRVIAGINPFDARFADFRNNDSPATYASVVRQAGPPFRGLVALNGDKNVVENTGLIELYTTVIERAKSLSINLNPPPANSGPAQNAILLAASRIADLQLLLGHEAFSDAQDPTIGFGTGSAQYGALAPTIFCFQNQVASLMDEELALLRGRAEEGAYPVWNRLLWNFTRAEGEAAYALSYGITDQNGDGFINETDGRLQYPQGHGDAWGHYLSALRTYYDLLRHPNFVWQARSENLQIDGVVVAVDYLDERKFAQAAAAKARAGAEVVNLTYRSRYVEDPDGQWQGYQDTDANRAWGVSDWARRAACGALYDWITANALLPAADTNRTGIERVDRTTVKDLAQISAQAIEIRKQVDNANTGLNPLGLASDTVPFDIDPVGLDASVGLPATHFEQVYERARKAAQNALDLFNHANELNEMLRQSARTADQFAADADAQDRDYRNRLIEIFGTPYEGTIGPGKAYPPGYTGPDLYLYMYADVTGLQSIPAPNAEYTAYFAPMDAGLVVKDAPEGQAKSIQSAWSMYFPGDEPPSLADNTKTDFTDRLELKLPQTAASYAFQAPADWGKRASPGQVHQVLSELVQAEADLQLALHAYDGVIGDLKDLTMLIRAQSGLQADQFSILERGRRETIGLNAGIQVAEVIAGQAELSAEIMSETADVAADSLPTIVGLATDAFAAVKGAIKGMGFYSKQILKNGAFALERVAAGLESSKELSAMIQERSMLKADFKYAMQEQLKEFEAKLGDEAAARIEVFRRQEVLRQVSDKYRATLTTGLRLMEEREQANKDLAGAVQENRYRDFTYRVFRNEALAKYRAGFELAARYAYLAAKAYDYETNLDPNDPASARPILGQIVRARTLGVLQDGNPRLGSGGLADALAALSVNYGVLKTQMGFNNPQTETGRFSLRNELFRILPGPLTNGTRNLSTTQMVTYEGRQVTAAQAWELSDAKWRDALQNTSSGVLGSSVVPDLWQLPEFRRYCRPFAPESAGAQPGLVLTFGTQVVFGKNFFGWTLGGGDSSYDPSHFATKIRSVGLWFENYNGEGLSATPRAYLVPVGVDIMTVPTSLELATREWNVVDQKIPIPLPVGQSNLRDPNWIPVRDSLNGTVAEIRRYSMFRAYHDAGFTADEMSSDSRLIGRSVWNTRWMLIIPGGSLLAGGQEGLDTFIKGRVVPGGTARDGNGVKDIKLFFQTYAYSGN